MPYCSIKGRKVHYEFAGEGEAVIFLHSLGTSFELWREQFEELKPNFRVIGLDFNGHGESESQMPFTMEDAALDLLNVMDVIAVESAHLVGISMGGHIALEVYSRTPERVRSLTLADTWAYMAKEIVVERTKFRIGKLDLSLQDFCRELATVSLISDADENTIQRLQSCMKFSKETYESAWHAVHGVDFRELLAKVNVPVLVFVGDQDKSSPAPYAEELASGISGAELIIVTNGGHLSHLTNAPLFNSHITKFLKGDK